MSADTILTEKLQILNGERGDKTKAAVRRGDVTPKALKSKQLTSAPTMADYNALQADIAALWSVISGAASKK